MSVPLSPRDKNIYRCVYCRKRINTRGEIPAHEAVCTWRLTVRKQWAYAIERARRRERAREQVKQTIATREELDA